MAEALFELCSNGAWQAESAGSKPAGYVHPLAIKAMAELGADISKNTSKHLDQFVNEPFDLVVTVCGNADDACPTFPNAKIKEHWPFDDPAHAQGTDEEIMAVFLRVRNEIKTKIESFLKQS